MGSQIGDSSGQPRLVGGADAGSGIECGATAIQIEVPVGHILRVQSMTKTFRGVVFHGVRDIRVEDRPFSTTETIAETDAVVKVSSARISLFRTPRRLMSRTV